jgi:molecular chaperone DnaK
VVDVVKKHFRKEPCKGVHPEEVVALGAAIQAHALIAQEGELLLLDVTPQSLGVAVAGGFVRKVIGRNTTVPTSASQMFSTSKDNQESVRIYVLQGEHEVAHENELLGEFILTGLRKAPRGEVEIEVTFDINSEGIVSVSARDSETGLRQSITVTASGGLTDEEMQRILDEQREYLLAAQAADTVKARRTDLEALVREVAEALPRVRALASSGDFGMDAVDKAELHLEQARRVLGDSDLTAVTEAVDLLGRTLTVLRGVSQRLSGG